MARPFQRHGLTRRRIDVVLVLAFVMLPVSALAQAGVDGRSTRAWLAASTGCSSGSGAVAIFDFGYMPSPCEVSTGASVTWTNTGQKTHTVTRCDDRCPVGPGSAPASSAFDTTLPPGARGPVTFSSPGSYVYFCTIHGYQTMHGEVDVAQAAPTTPTTTHPPTRPPAAGAGATTTTKPAISTTVPAGSSTIVPTTSPRHAPNISPTLNSNATAVGAPAVAPKRPSSAGGGPPAWLIAVAGVAVVAGAAGVVAARAARSGRWPWS